MIVPTDIGWNEPFEIDSLRLETTCPSTPEQYDVFLGDEKVGYIRLRDGEFTVECPDVGGELVFDAWPSGDSCFDPDEREHWLTEAAHAIRNWIRLNKGNRDGQDNA